MPLAITEEHQALADVVRSFTESQGLLALARKTIETPDGVTQPGPAWTEMAQLGWAGLHLPEEYGGSGFGLPELAVVTEGLGAAVGTGPLLATAVASAVVSEAGTAEQRRELLPALADGSDCASVALHGSTKRDKAGRLTGDSGPALGGSWADLHLIGHGDDLLVVRAGDAPVDAITGLDTSLGLAHLDLSRTTLGESSVLRGGRSLAIRVLRTLAAAEAAGGARACLDRALEYAKVREQFGRTIGSFQAIKHHLADMLVRSEQAVAAAWDAARAGSGGPESDLAAAVAATVALEAYLLNARMNIQIHGGIGFTWEHDAHLYLRRATALAAIAGPLRGVADDAYLLTARGVRREYTVALPPEAERYRAEVADFVVRYRSAPTGERRRLLVESGYLVPHWPRPWGRAAGPSEQLVIEEEFADLDVPNLGIGAWVLLTLIQTASEDQIARWLPSSLLGELVWCQLFSEPGAGSDAAAVQTRGTCVDGGWKVTGQKVWTSGAQDCHRGLATVRTDPDAPKHKGITAMVIDLTAHGVTVKPLREITGDALFNEVFLDDVFVPDADVVGEVGDGWSVARATLGNERVSIGGGGRFAVSAVDLIKVLRRCAPADAGLARQVGELIAEGQALRSMNLRRVERAIHGAHDSAEGSVTKLLTAEHAQRVSELGMNIAGPAGITGRERKIAWAYLWDRAITIAGGTSEVSRNVIAERILGLPREETPR